MKKKLIAAAIATAIITPLAAQASGSGPTVYGKLHVTVDNLDRDSNAGDYWQVESRASRLGFKGSEDLGNGLSAIYKMEFEVDVDGDDADNITARNQYVGLASKSYGTILLGYHDTPYKVITGKDMFSDRIADWNKLGFTAGVKGIVEDKRAENAILYTSPKFNGVTVSAMVSPGESDADDNINDKYTSVAAKYENGPLYIGLAYEETELAGIDSASPTQDDKEKWRIYSSYKIGAFKIGGMYQDVDNESHFKEADSQAWQINGTYSFGNTALMVAYQEGEVEDDRAASAAYDSPEYDSIVVAVDHKLSKRTKLYALYTQSDTNDDAKNAASLASGSDDWDALSFGIVHKF